MKYMYLITGAGGLLAITTAVSMQLTQIPTVADRSYQPRATREEQLAAAEDPVEKELLAELLDRYEEINADYGKTVRPHFERACFDCHAAPAELPWYAVIPGVRQLIAHDITEAKSHLDMSGEFPFAGHGSVEEDLQALEKTIRAAEMPPWEYLLIHRNAGLNQKDKEDIYSWLERTSRALSN